MADDPAHACPHSQQASHAESSISLWRTIDTAAFFHPQLLHMLKVQLAYGGLVQSLPLNGQTLASHAESSISLWRIEQLTHRITLLELHMLKVQLAYGGIIVAYG